MIDTKKELLLRRERVSGVTDSRRTAEHRERLTKNQR